MKILLSIIIILSSVYLAIEIFKSIYEIISSHKKPKKESACEFLPDEYDEEFTEEFAKETKEYEDRINSMKNTLSNEPAIEYITEEYEKFKESVV